MKSSTTSFLWEGDARWITSFFIVYLFSSSVYIVSGFLKTALVGTMVASAVVIFAGGAAGLNSSRLFGGRRNFTGRLLLLFSVSIFTLGSAILAAIPVFYYESNAFLSTSVAGLLVNSLFILGLSVAAYALIVSARATFERFDRAMIARVLIAIAIVSLEELVGAVGAARALPGSTVLSAFLFGLPFVVVLSVLFAGALILVAQLGKWYATPGISIVAYGYVVIGIVPGMVRGLLLLSGIVYSSQVSLFIAGPTVVFFFVGLGLNKIRPKLKRLARPSGTVS